jgi:hypothetical protein
MIFSDSGVAFTEGKTLQKNQIISGEPAPSGQFFEPRGPSPGQAAVRLLVTHVCDPCAERNSRLVMIRGHIGVPFSRNKPFEQEEDAVELLVLGRWS